LKNLIFLDKKLFMEYRGFSRRDRYAGIPLSPQKERK